MSRPPRIYLPDIPQHVYQRGHNKQACFKQSQDYAVYLKLLSKYSAKFSVSVHAYVLMTNHVHILLTPKLAKSVSLMMQSLNKAYVLYFNKSYHRSGTLWGGRFKSIVVAEEQYFLILSRYIELNPVRAKVAITPDLYHWSSFKHNALGDKKELITENVCYLQLGENDSVRQQSYLALFNEAISNESLNKIRHSVHQQLCIGDEKFTQKIEGLAEKSLKRFAWGGDRRSDGFKDIYG